MNIQNIIIKYIIEYHFYGSNLQQDKINKAVKLSVDKYCGVMEMFRQFAEVTTEICIFMKQLKIAMRWTLKTAPNLKKVK